MAFDRKFEAWEFRDEAFPENPVKVEVRYRGPDNKAEGPIEYYVKTDVPRIDARAEEFEPLRKRVLEQLRAWYVIDWEKRICLTLSLETERGYGKDKTLVFEPRFEVVEFTQGTMRRDEGKKGAPVYYEGGRMGGVRTGTFKPDVYSRKDTRWVVVADTPEVRAKVEAIGERFLEAQRGLVKELMGLPEFRDASLATATEAEA